MNHWQPATSNGRATAPSGQPTADEQPRSLWFDPPTDDQDHRPRLTRERVVTEALAVIAEDGVQALTMRGLAARLGVVPGAVYRHVRNKQQVQDLLLDGVLAEIDFHLDPSVSPSEQLKVLAHRLRQVLERHPGVAGILKTRDPLGPHSLALAEAFLSRYRLPGSPPWSPWASTSGSTTGTSGSTPAWRPWLPGWSTPAPPASHHWRGARAGTIKDARRPEGRWMNDPQDLNRPDQTHPALGHSPS
jgi:AcrR family transcriptional regulator